MTAPLKVLISGASIAGPTLAYWLCRHGHEVTVVERASSVRPGGYPIDIRGTAVGVVERMGALEEVQAAHIHTKRVAFYDGRGGKAGELRPEELTGGVIGRDYELPRGNLTSILWDLTRDDVRYRFNDSITVLEQDDQGVDVEFEQGEAGRFDLVFGADGLHSNVRRLAFGEESQFHKYLGWCFAGFTMPNHFGMDREGCIYNTPGRMATIYAVGDSPERVYGLMAFATAQPSYEVLRDNEAMRDLVADAFAQNTSWRIPMMVDALRSADDSFCDSVSQIHMPRWSQARVALVGDAAHATSFLSGQGTSVSLVTPYIVAGELAASGRDHVAAFDAYERTVREFVRQNQEIANRSNGVCVASAMELRIRNIALRRVVPVLAKLGLTERINGKTRKATTALALPSYA
jgi:2-polyprenyl-6-methoxyphenol hydroxylase-like FAD-dependent oxidoreductase